MTLEEIKNAIIELSNKVAKYSITPGIVANLLEELRLKLEEIFSKLSSVVGAVMSISIMPSASKLVMTLTKSDKKEQNVSLPAATKVSAGVMSALDKTNLDYLVTHGATVKFDNAMSATSENGVQNKVIKAYVDGKFDKTNILSVGIQDEVPAHFDSYSVVNIMDGNNLVATILLNTHSQSTKGILFQHGAGWKIVTEELGDIIGAGWSQVLDDMESKSVPVGEGGGGIDEEQMRIIASFSPHIVYEDVDGVMHYVGGYISGNATFRDIGSTIKKIHYGGFGTNGNYQMAFNGCENLEEIYPIMINSGITSSGGGMNLYQPFNGCKKLKSIEMCKYWGTSESTSMERCFVSLAYEREDISLEPIQGWNVGKVTTMINAFSSCGAKEIILPNWNNNIISVAERLFDNCPNVRRIDIRGINTQNVTYMTYMFGRCPNLEWVNAPQLSLASCKGTTGMFSNCTKLVTLIGDMSYQEVVGNNVCIFNGWKGSLYTGFSYCPFNQATLRAIINGVADLTGQTTGNLDFGKANKAKLNADDIAVATAKNWTIS